MILICRLFCFLNSSFHANQLPFPAPLLSDLQSSLSMSDVFSFDQQLILKNLLSKYAVNMFMLHLCLSNGWYQIFINFSCKCNERLVFFYLYDRASLIYTVRQSYNETDFISTKIEVLSMKQGMPSM